MSLSIETKSVLLVEDNPGDARLVHEVLKDGTQLIELSLATDGQQALDMLENLRPDIILLDLNLPKINGREVLRSIKNDPELKRIPVIVLSTSEEEADINGAYEDHANSYISKPLDFDRFTAIVRDIEHYWLGSLVTTLPN